MRKIITFFQDVRTELKAVTWPTRHQALKMTTIVLTSSIFVGLIIAALDYLFTLLLTQILL